MEEKKQNSDLLINLSISTLIQFYHDKLLILFLILKKIMQSSIFQQELFQEDFKITVQNNFKKLLISTKLS